MQILEAQQIGSLIGVLHARGYTVIAPTRRDGAIILDAISSAGELPQGWTDEQAPGEYALEKRNDGRYFGYTVGPFAWKKFLFPPKHRLFAATKAGKAFTVDSGSEEAPPRYAFLGVRACELEAMKIQDRVFAGGEYVDRHYSAIRKEALIIAVNCGEARGTCFCVSMRTGPKVAEGFDLALTEIGSSGSAAFVVEIGSARGKGILDEIPHRKAEPAEVEAARLEVEHAASGMEQTLNTDRLPKILNDQFEHPHWEEIAKRCLACANCTLVCPTCFCSTVKEVTDLTGDHAQRWRSWDSCFTNDFTKIAGGNIRMSTRTRYRQWLMHKLAHWVDQFGTFGCVGCGRCITWCPVGINIAAEATALREGVTAPRSN
jgi:sulfhydrogenase subunit beta (sulfur reductase)